MNSFNFFCALKNLETMSAIVQNYLAGDCDAGFCITPIFPDSNESGYKVAIWSIPRTVLVNIIKELRKKKII